MFTRSGPLPGEGFYTPIPTHWMRDPRLPALGFRVLCFWVSHAVGYRVTVEQTVAEVKEGRDAVYKAVKILDELGYVRRSQARGGGGNSTQGGSTKFGAVEYELGPAAFTQTYTRAWGRQPDPVEGQPTEPLPESQDAVPPEDVSAGQTASWKAVSGKAVYGNPDTKKEQGITNKRENPPPPKARKRATRPATPAQAQEEAAEATLEEQYPGVDPAFVAQVRAVAKHWHRRLIFETLAHPDVLTHDPEAVRRAMLALAGGKYGGTNSPRRLIEAGPWWPDAYTFPELGHLPTSPTKPCTNPDCHRGRVTVTTPGPGGQPKDTVVECPTCRPAATA